jgi:AraC family transcriptional regulator, ethanolamine operon transcriptional activator
MVCSIKHSITRNADEQEIGLLHWRQGYDQLSSGPFEGKVTDIWVNGTQLFRETINCRTGQSGRAWDGSFVICMPISLARGSLFAEQPVPRGAIICARGGQEFSLITQSDSDIMGLAIPGETLAEAMGQDSFRVFEEQFPREPAVISCANHHLNKLKNILVALLSEPNAQLEFISSPQLHQSFDLAVAGFMSSFVSSAKTIELPSRSFRGRCQMVQMITAYVLANADKGVTIADLSAHFNLSRRMLNYYFQEVLAINPVYYFRQLRLNAVRKDLRMAREQGVLVRDVAEKWGFFHFSRFSAEYRQLFGEYPSFTLHER